MIRSSNPAVVNLNRYVDTNVESASYGGVAWKAIFFVGLSIVGAVLGWFLLFQNPGLTYTLLFVSMGVTLVCALLSSFVPKTTPITGTVYALAQGFMLGTISALFDSLYSGIVLGAFLSTMVVFGIMMILYSTKVIKVGKRFQAFIFSALLGLLVTQLLIMILSFAIPQVSAVFYGSGPIAIIVSVVMVIIASLCILSDLNNITVVVENGLPKTYEWRAAFGLSVTLLWLYLEFLRLFAIIAASSRK